MLHSKHGNYKLKFLIVKFQASPAGNKKSPLFGPMGVRTSD